MGGNMGWMTVVSGFLTTVLTVAISNGWLPEGSEQAGTDIIDGLARVVQGFAGFFTIYGLRRAQAKAIAAAPSE